ncbi:hypothetical protein NMY22_g267 [Coprinellus aureogranulatus]|nr:hypothetical protein NMY22_g267 [Coprinellus aureogranulatus]
MRRPPPDSLGADHLPLPLSFVRSWYAVVPLPGRTPRIRLFWVHGFKTSTQDPAGYGVSVPAWTTTDNDVGGELADVLRQRCVSTASDDGMRPDRALCSASLQDLLCTKPSRTSSILAYLGLEARIYGLGVQKSYTGTPSVNQYPTCNEVTDQQAVQEFRIADWRRASRKASTIHWTGDGFDLRPADESDTLPRVFWGRSQHMKHLCVPKTPSSRNFSFQDLLVITLMRVTQTLNELQLIQYYVDLRILGTLRTEGRKITTAPTQQRGMELTNVSHFAFNALPPFIHRTDRLATAEFCYAPTIIPTSSNKGYDWRYNINSSPPGCLPCIFWTTIKAIRYACRQDVKTFMADHHPLRFLLRVAIMSDGSGIDWPRAFQAPARWALDALLNAICRTPEVEASFHTLGAPNAELDRRIIAFPERIDSGRSAHWMGHHLTELSHRLRAPF